MNNPDILRGGNYEAPDDFQESYDDFKIKDVSARPTLYSTDWTASSAVSQILRGVIELTPSFQRRAAWTIEDKSKFIESLVLGIPIPQVILAENPRSRRQYVVIDGKQRLLTLVQFLSEVAARPDWVESFKLKGLTERSDLNGKSFKDLVNTAEGFDIENAVIRTVIIKSVSDENFLYEAFLRLNTQSKKLSPQELRQALSPGPFTDFIDDVALRSTQMKRALNIKEPDRRMRDNELILRFIGFSSRLHEYKGDLKVFLDDTTKHFNANWGGSEDYLDGLEDALDAAISATFAIFGDGAFQVFDKAGYSGRFNRAVFDIMTFFFADALVRGRAVERPQAVEAAYKELCTHDEVFRIAFSSTTKTVDNLFCRLDRWRSALQMVVGLDVPQLELRDGRIFVQR